MIRIEEYLQSAFYVNIILQTGKPFTLVWFLGIVVGSFLIIFFRIFFDVFIGNKLNKLFRKIRRKWKKPKK